MNLNDCHSSEKAAEDIFLHFEHDIYESLDILILCFFYRSKGFGQWPKN